MQQHYRSYCICLSLCNSILHHTVSQFIIMQQHYSTIHHTESQFMIMQQHYTSYWIWVYHNATALYIILYLSLSFCNAIYPHSIFKKVSYYVVLYLSIMRVVQYTVSHKTCLIYHSTSTHYITQRLTYHITYHNACKYSILPHTNIIPYLLQESLSQ